MTSSNFDELPKNCIDVFTVGHHYYNPNFTTPLHVTVTNKDISVRVRLPDQHTTNELLISEGVSEGDTNPLTLNEDSEGTSYTDSTDISDVNQDSEVISSITQVTRSGRV